MNKSSRCLYNGSFEEFLNETEESILGTICQNYHGDIGTTSRNAWVDEISIMKNIISEFRVPNSQIIFEYDIPRLGKRIDVVLLLKGIIFCLEFKVGEKHILEADVDQVLDYALDLNNFHKYSQNKVIVPILVATKHNGASSVIQPSGYTDRVMNPLMTGTEGLYSLISMALNSFPKEEAINEKWINSPYAPTPTIIEAARSLYENHSVEDITRHEADKVYTDRTIAYVLDVIHKSKAKGEKSICFVTGVPGAGKTLVGLDVAVKQTYQGGDSPVDDEGAVYLSGNGPLVAVLTEALARDNYEKCKVLNKKKTKTDSKREVGKSIQMIHRYRDNMLHKIKNPVENGKLEIDPEKAERNDTSGFGEVEHVAIFDEAQRAWTHERLAAYLKRGGTYGNKLKVPNFPVSEAAFLIWSLDQREDWATIICLVGGGQEINTGEAGISEWINAINEHFPHWKVYISPMLTEPEYAEGKVNELLEVNNNVTFSDDLHLKVSLRSYRAEKLSAFVHSVLTFNPNAKNIYEEIKDNYPIVLTRDMDKAREWLHKKVRGTERTGVLVTKEAARFKPLAIHILETGDENAVHWFLEDKDDTRSSNYLEDAATEIQVQGLELDYTCLLWDADMRYDNGKWRYYRFNGSTKWIERTGKSEKEQEQMKYMLNAYRVLLTRARAGMVICVPKGNSNMTPSGFYEDNTRLPEFYDGTYEYLKSVGLMEI
ncbi:DNA/RNA helicase domain-containing protein [Pseudobutyrivibrio sp. LB2011]|uniref:DNA/RNA helicase domain-containing protein n=1 Tax=Pseudobutyrivibrio sp. LB2011 TaxID=1408312 RepID=UPI0005D22488|nr:DNA/RNA helicase domain-containing protein [Pseudobutyrivibrio sp. LB2011]